MRTLTLCAGLAALWLLLSGYFDNPLLLFFGAASVAVTAYLSERADVADAEGVPAQMFPSIIGYWAWLGGEIGKANVIVARQALAIEPKLSPAMFEVKTPTKTAAGLATFANSITLTPGTVTVDVAPGRLLIHALTEDLADVAAVADMGRRVAASEGEAS
ncbi:MAG: Na+/H+ antiporter subunit E [Parvularculaceae bacterium]